MSILKRLPWVSLSLLLLTYATYGWVISQANVPSTLWILAAIASLLLISGLTTPWTRITDYSFFLFQSHLRSFGVSVLGSFLFFLMIAWFRLFLDTLVLIAAAMLVRIDLQTASFREGQAFWILLIVSLTGLGVGVFIDKLI